MNEPTTLRQIDQQERVVIRQMNPSREGWTTYIVGFEVIEDIPTFFDGGLTIEQINLLHAGIVPTRRRMIDTHMSIQDRGTFAEALTTATQMVEAGTEIYVLPYGDTKPIPQYEYHPGI
jgi:hypothetical protein